MADMPGRYWDLDECGWVRFPPAPVVDVPQQTGAQETGVEAEREADVRSG